jgi:hypothetical protein
MSKVITTKSVSNSSVVREPRSGDRRSIEVIFEVGRRTSRGAMNAGRVACAMFLVVAPLSIGCDTESYEDGPGRVCVNAAGTWDVTMVGEPSGTIVCPNRNVVWTINQIGCDVTIQTESWDPANGATGGLTDNYFYASWFWSQDCHEIHESINVTVDGDTMTGDFYRTVVRVVYGEYCPGGGICSASFNAVRRAP